MDFIFFIFLFGCIGILFLPNYAGPIFLYLLFMILSWFYNPN